MYNSTFLRLNRHVNSILSVLLLLFSGVAMSEVYKEGQYWAYDARDQDEGAYVLINKIESHEKLGKIFHISFFNVKVKNPMISGGFSKEVPHSPVSKETLDKSVTRLLGTKPENPDYLGGYKTWKEAFDAGKAGVFTIELREIVDGVEQAINH